MPRISIIFPVYNTASFLKESVDSILNQSFADFELIIINDASTDQSWEILQTYNDPRIRLLNNEVNLGVPKTRNKALDLATGEFIANMDSDDVAHPDRLKRQVQFLDHYLRVDVCGSWVQFIGAWNGVLQFPAKHEDIRANLLFVNIINNPSIMLRRAILEKLRYDETFALAEDYKLWVELIDTCTIAIIPEVLLQYRIHTSNVSIVKKCNQQALQQYNCRVYERFFQRLAISYNKEELRMHLEIGQKQITALSTAELTNYLAWLGKLIVANRSTHYFKDESFRTVILNQVQYLASRVKHSAKAYPLIVSFLCRYFRFSDLGRLLKLKTMNYVSRNAVKKFL